MAKNNLNYPIYPYYGKKTVCAETPLTFPPQHQDRQPGMEYLMEPRPIFDYSGYIGSGKLSGKVAVITGGDSGIGRATAVAFAKEQADVVIVYLDEHRDAEETKAYIERLGRRCLALPVDLRLKGNCFRVIEQAVQAFGRLDILVNNHAVQFAQKNILEISEEQLYNTFQTNILSFFFLVQAALPHLKNGSAIINTASIVAYAGHEELLDYSSTKGAIVSFTRSLAIMLADKGIRVNAVAPGPVWTPLTVSCFSAEEVSVFGLRTQMKRAGQPFELAPAYVYLASDDSRFATGECIHVNGGQMVTT